MTEQLAPVPPLAEDEAGLPGPAIGEPPVALDRHQPFRSLRHREFRLLFTAYAIGDLGFWISHISLQSEMARVTDNSSIWLGILFFGTFIPMLLFVMPFVMVGSWLNGLVPILEEQQGLSQQAAVKSGVFTIDAGLQRWAADHGGEYPAPGRVTADRLVREDGDPYVHTWPLNPYTDLPMDQGTGPGQFTYRVEARGRDYHLVGYGEGRAVLIAVSRPRPEATAPPLP